QETRMEAELAVKRDMLRAVREREQAGMADAPALELLAGRGDEALADAAVPEIRADRQRPENPDAAPTDREVRSRQRAVLLGGEGGDVIGAKAAVDVIPIGPEILQVGRADKGAEGQRYDSLRFRQIGVGEWANDSHARLLTTHKCPRMLPPGDRGRQRHRRLNGSLEVRHVFC